MAISTADPLLSSSSSAIHWTPTLAAPLMFAAVLAFPLIGPFLHGIVIFCVGLGLVEQLATPSGAEWFLAALLVAVSGIGLAAAVGFVRYVVGRVVLAGSRKVKFA
jgi:hypothetical protein